MEKNVCMFVWNHFTNDARVLRECTALSSDDYNVDLICIDDPQDSNLQKFEERNPSFRIHRVRRYPVLLDFFQGILRNKLFLVIALLVWALLVYWQPIVVLAITVVLGVVAKTRLRVVWVRGNICLRMILLAYRRKYDIYHSNDLNTLLQGWVCAKLRIRKKKLIYDSHEVQTSRTGYDSKMVGKIEGFFIKRIDSMIVENATRAQYNEDLYGFYPYVVHNYPFKQESNNAEMIDMRNLLGLPQGEKILLYQGGVQMGRGLEELVKAAPLFDEGTLVFIGDGRIKPQLEQMVRDMQLEEKVRFIPKVPLDDLLKYTRNAYLGFQVLQNICFNHYSASSNKLFEYMMCNVPVVACDFPEIKGVVEGENIGVCIDSHDFKSIAQGVNTLLNNPDLHAQMQRNCERARGNYNWEEEKAHLFNVYRDVTMDRGYVVSA